MKSKQDLINRQEWLKKALKMQENQEMLQQCKLYAQLDLINWILEGSDEIVIV